MAAPGLATGYPFNFSTAQIKINLPKLPPTFLFRRWLLLCHGLGVLRFHLSVKLPDTVLVIQDLFGALVLGHQ